MTRYGSWWMKVALVGAVPLVFLLAYLDLRREEARALDDFTAAQSALARAEAATLSARLDGDPAGLRLDLEAPTDLTRRLLVDPSGKWSAGNPDSGDNAEVAALVTKMRTGQEGSALLSRPAADSLGLGPRLAVAGYAPVHAGARPPWSLAVITSARRVRDRARVSGYRLAAATGLAGLLVGLFALAIGRQQRREAALAGKLALSEATSALRERSEKMFEVLPIGILAFRNGVITFANPYLAKRGIEPGLLGGAFADDELAVLQALILDAVESQRPCQRLGIRLHLPLPLPAGARCEIDAYAVPVTLPDADCFVVLHDRTLVRALERNLARAEKLSTIGTLAAGIAHELGTPLGIISGRAEQLLALGDERLAKSVTSILAQVEKVSTTIRQLLDFARLRPVDAAVITAAQAVGNVAALLDHRFRHAKVTLDVAILPTLAPIAGDPGQLEQVLANLLINACDACQPGDTVTVRAAPATADEAGMIVITISDDGAGIAAEHLPLVLDPFFTTKKRGQGTGLGLSIAADIVKNHGGSLDIDSVEGQGTTVRVLLPRAKESA